MFDRYVGIDYSGAQHADARLPGLRVFVTSGDAEPTEVRTAPLARTHWTRRTLAHWLIETLTEPATTLIGIDHGFSFPQAYFERYELPSRWRTFLDDFRRHWPTDDGDVRVDDVRQGRAGRGADRAGEARWRRLTERRAGGAKSVFHFDVPGSVAKSTHAGLPWLRRITEHGGVHVWPFDGWDIPAGRSAIAEIYPSLWRDRYERGDRTDDQHDAFVVAAGLRDADRRGELAALLQPDLAADERAVVQAEGWILGVT